MSKYNQVAEVLVEAKTRIGQILIDDFDELHRIKLINSLQNMADSILLITGSATIGFTGMANLPPATHVGKNPILRAQKVTARELEPDETEVDALQEKITQAWTGFAEKSAENILKEFDDITIRGVAKKARLFYVTKDKPKALTVEFIKKIQDAVLEVQAIEV